MGIIAWIILGALSGWIASIVTGIVGAFIGGIVFNFIGTQKVTGLNLHSILVSVVGACILLWVVGLFNRK